MTQRVLAWVVLLGLSAAPALAERVTIVAERFEGADRVRQADAYAEAFNARTALDGWHVVHLADASLLMHGRYENANDPTLARDRSYIGQITNKQGEPLFQRVRVVPLAAPDPDAPGQWDLRSAKGRWTVVIAAYNGPQRKQAAVESVRAAREMGVEAYYFHGDSISQVTIGVFPDRAATYVNPAEDRPVGSENQTVMTTSVPLPEAMRRGMVDDNGRPMEVVVPKFNIHDERLAEVLRTYREYAVNGEIAMIEARGTDGVTRMRPQGSFVADLSQLRAADPEPRPTDGSVTPTGEPEADLLRRRGSGGGLRSLDGE